MSQKVFLLELKVLNSNSACFQVCTIHQRFRQFFSILKVTSLHMICKIKNFVNKTYIIIFIAKTKTKRVTPLTAYEKNLSAFSAAKKILVYYDKNCWLCTTNSICDKSQNVNHCQGEFETYQYTYVLHVSHLSFVTFVSLYMNKVNILVSFLHKFDKKSFRAD